MRHTAVRRPTFGSAAVVVLLALFASVAVVPPVAASPLNENIIDGCVDYHPTYDFNPVEYSLRVNGCVAYAGAVGACQDAILNASTAACTPVAFANATASVTGDVARLTRTLGFGGVPAQKASAYYTAAATQSANERDGQHSLLNIELEEKDCQYHWGAQAYNRVKYTKSNIWSDRTYMRRTAGCATYKATTHATVGVEEVANGDTMFITKWEAQDVEENASAYTFEGTKQYTRRGETWGATMGGTWYHKDFRPGNYVWRVGLDGEMDLYHTDDS